MTDVVTFVTCDRLGTKPDTDGRLLAPRLRQLGVEANFRPWGGTPPDPLPTAYIVKATWDYIERPDVFAEWITTTAARSPIWNDPDLLRWNLHKSYLLDLANAGLPIVPTRLVYRGASATDAWAAKPWPEVVVKPAISVGALNTRRFSAADTAGAAFLAELLAGGDALIQSFVPSILTEGETSLVYIADQFSHAVRKGVLSGGFAAQASLGVDLRLVEPTPAQRRLADAVMARLGTPLFARLDLVQHDGTPTIMEVELIEPALFLDLCPAATERLAQAIVDRIADTKPTETP